MGVGSQPQRLEELGAGTEAGADHDRVGGEDRAPLQLDPGQATVGTGDEARDPGLHDVHAGTPQAVELVGVDAGGVVDHHGQPVGELAEERRGVQAHGVGDDLDHPGVAHLVAVAERAVHHVAAPVLPHALDVGQLVDESAGDHHPPGHHRGPAGQGGPERAPLGAFDGDHPSGEHLRPVAAHLLPTSRHQLGGGHALVPEVAVHVGGRGVPRVAGVDDDDGSALAGDLQGGGEAGGGAADHEHVAVAFHRWWGVVAHGDDPTESFGYRNDGCGIRKMHCA